ncbi:30S ribosomal protein S12 methylthiotransferase RimO [Propionibacterium australiense]|uniref:Ribosomal protein uS12 methylthiotransferase RimO n=1 Tax=Propionibacterium australiense TaxID=119981 RepID=A0A383S4I4_9ACTN|nr:30S ribosomal protein S12 methylthiotransferase RimO [Propionibacterium australiense]RLP10624.1 30S ribosomal protein S12 methylthiotransferase RimO [Propionibacterium australiense]SYZ32827.1 ribosomal protein S12 methylthiotransferase (RimO-like) [Propionibacterium australiense]VEH91165.1 Ribosomal protein S12 methylthiotransferase RimO [Propionibacterium australiense]
MAQTTVHLISLGCARNDVDSEELAARLEAGGLTLVDDPEQADALMVNTCGFIEQAKKDSIDTILAVADHKTDGRAKAVVAVGCLAQRYGRELAEALPEADAVLGFDDYTVIADRLRRLLAGDRLEPPEPRQDRRRLLPITPVDRQQAAASRNPVEPPEHLLPASGPRLLRRRLGDEPWAPLKIASGCDRRCAFCAIPGFRGAYLSREPDELVTEARWLVEQGVRELMLVSENSSSYGKDLGDRRALEKLLGELSRIDGLERIRVSYLQPAELRPGLLDVMLGTDKVVPYFDISFQHAAPAVLRRMRRYGDPESFLDLIGRIRSGAPQAGFRTNVIVGFPGETAEDIGVLADFLSEARMDVIGVFSYSDEEGTAAEKLDGHVDEDEIACRHRRISDLADELVNQRAAERIGERVSVLVESTGHEFAEGRAAHQGPEVDGVTTLRIGPSGAPVRVGELVAATVVASDGADLVAEPVAGSGTGLHNEPGQGAQRA